MQVYEKGNLWWSLWDKLCQVQELYLVFYFFVSFINVKYDRLALIIQNSNIIWSYTSCILFLFLLIYSYQIYTKKYTFRWCCTTKLQITIGTIFVILRKRYFYVVARTLPYPILVAGPLVDLLFASSLTKSFFWQWFSIVIDLLICLKKDISCNNSSSNILTFNLPFYKQEKLPIWAK
mgnify:CR=1 FL=1